MGNTLNDPDFMTARGPRDARLTSGVGLPIRYTMRADLNEHYPTDGSPRTFYSICTVKVEDKWNFVKSILPDVYEDTQNPLTGSSSYMSLKAYSLPPIVSNLWTRNPLIRLNPQRHPIHQRAFAVDAVVLGGIGYPTRNETTNDLTFRQFRPELPKAESAAEGYVNVAVTWKDLPYEVEIHRLMLEMTISGAPTNGEGVGSPLTTTDMSNVEANKAQNSEIIRYCVFKPTPKGQNVGISGGQAWFIDDDGSIITGTGGNPVPCPPEANVYFVPATNFSVTWRMVPRVPFAAEALRGMCNSSQNIPIPIEVLRDLPDTGTVRFMGYELSDPYYTCSGTKVYDITYSLGYRPGGNTTPNRGWNSTYCGSKRDFRRFVYGKLATTPTRITTVDGVTITLPITNDSQVDQTPRLVTAAGCIAPFTDLQNLFRFEGERLTG